jgi:hypothetical protein
VRSEDTVAVDYDSEVYGRVINLGTSSCFIREVLLELMMKTLLMTLGRTEDRHRLEASIAYHDTIDLLETLLLSMPPKGVFLRKFPPLASPYTVSGERCQGDAQASCLPQQIDQTGYAVFLCYRSHMVLSVAEALGGIRKYAAATG